MVRSILLLIMFAIFSGNTLYAKNGKKDKKEVLTLTKGKYVEVFDIDSVEQIGSVLLNVYTQKVIGFTNDEATDTEKYLAADIISRRWNLDPMASKYPGISPYSCFGNNPILYSDPLGNTWTVSTDAETKKDVQGIASNSKNQQYIKVGDNGNVSLDFGDMSKKSINKLLKKDDGLNLANQLVNAKEDYYYSTSPDFQSRGLKEDRNSFINGGGSANVYDGVNGAYTQNGWPGTVIGSKVASGSAIFYKNASETSYGTDSRGNQVPTLLPRTGYNGQVGLAKGDVLGTTLAAPTEQSVRYQMLRHELYENYLRTTDGQPYMQAHNQANQKFNGNFTSLFFIGR